MKKIPLRNKKIEVVAFALVDDDDFKRFNKFFWCLSASGYARRAGKGLEPTNVLLHRLILDAKNGEEVDHINRNTLDNRKENLRICDRSLNSYNSRKKIGISGYKGVWKTTGTKRWNARITKNGKRVYLGSFATREEAYAVRLKAEKELWGKNFIPAQVAF